MLIQEIVSASKPTLKDVLIGLEQGQSPDAKTVAALDRLMSKAEKAMLKMVVSDPDMFGIDTYSFSKNDIRSGANVHTTHIGFAENGLCFMMRVDTDNIGGSSDNAQDFNTDWSGAPIEDIGTQIGVLSVQDDFLREE